jgi:hypothetical protein
VTANPRHVRFPLPAQPVDARQALNLSAGVSKADIPPSPGNTQWKAWLALYHAKPLVIAKADDAAPRGPKYAPTDDSRAPAASG